MCRPASPHPAPSPPNKRGRFDSFALLGFIPAASALAHSGCSSWRPSSPHRERFKISQLRFLHCPGLLRPPPPAPGRPRPPLHPTSRPCWRSRRRGATSGRRRGWGADWGGPCAGGSRLLFFFLFFFLLPNTSIIHSPRRRPCLPQPRLGCSWMGADLRGMKRGKGGESIPGHPLLPSSEA